MCSQCSVQVSALVVLRTIILDRRKENVQTLCRERGRTTAGFLTWFAGENIFKLNAFLRTSDVHMIAKLRK